MSAYLNALRADADLMSAAIRTGDSSALVAACPEWDLSKLLEHTGWVHRWATDAIINGTAPARETDFGPGNDENLAVWIVEGAAALINAIGATEPDAPTWHPFSLEQQVWVWARRQALETAMHRWDAQTAIGVQAGLDPELSSEGIQEYFELGLPRVLSRAKIDPPAVSLHVHCTDVDGEWLVWGEDGKYRMLPVHDKGDAAIRGTAADIWLLLMGRLDRSELNIVGDASAADAWLDLPNW
ncbi:MAG: hypothetical protein ACI91Q_002988 [Gammaproteobacteria bacterium]|jgi:uncharacterized protein (TIGR03083 family)